MNIIRSVEETRMREWHKCSQSKHLQDLAYFQQENWDFLRWIIEKLKVETSWTVV